MESEYDGSTIKCLQNSNLILYVINSILLHCLILITVSLCVFVCVYARAHVCTCICVHVYLYCACMASMRMPKHVYGGHGTTLQNRFSLPTFVRVVRLELGTPDWHGKHRYLRAISQAPLLPCVERVPTAMASLTIKFYKFTNCVPLNYVVYLYPYIYCFVGTSRKIVLKKKYSIYRIKMGFCNQIIKILLICPNKQA